MEQPGWEIKEEASWALWGSPVSTKAPQGGAAITAPL